MFVKSKFMHATYTHAQITSRSLKKSLESAKLKIISSIHRPRDTAFEESCGAKDKVGLRITLNNAKEGRANTQGAAFWLLPSVTEEGFGSFGVSDPNPQPLRMHNINHTAVLVRMLCASVPLTDLAFKKQTFPLDFSTW